MNKIKAIANNIEENFTNVQIIQAWNLYCAYENMDDYVYCNDEYFFDEQFEKADEAVRAVCYGTYDYQDEYVVFNGYGNLDTFNGWEEDKSPISLDIIAEYLIEHGDSECNGIIDSDELCEEFILQYAEDNGLNVEDVRDKVEKYLEEEDFDFLTEDWNDLISYIQ